MDGPPALTIELIDARADAAIAVALTCLLMACLAALVACGALQSPERVLGAVFLVCTSLILTGCLVRRMRVLQPVSVLRWDGQSWYGSCGQGDALCSVQWMMDLRYWMLLQVRELGGGRAWLWLRRKAYAKNWYALRRALIFSARTAHDHAESGLSGQVL